MKLIRFLLLSLLLTCYSCSEDKISSTDKIKNQSFFPKVNSITTTNIEMVGTIKDNFLFKSGRINNNLNFEKAVTATYNGYNDLAFVYIPNHLSQNEYFVYTFKNNILLKDLTFSIKKVKDSLHILNRMGEIMIKSNNNTIEDFKVRLFESNKSKNGRVVYRCDPAKDFLDYESSIQDQLVDYLGEEGAILFDIGCSFWVVCRGSAIVAGVAYSIGNCI